MYVCMYVHTYICMYVCMYVHTYICMYVCMYVHTYICMYVCTYVHMYVCMYVRTYVCTHVYRKMHGNIFYPHLSASNVLLCVGEKHNHTYVSDKT